MTYRVAYEWDGIRWVFKSTVGFDHAIGLAAEFFAKQGVPVPPEEDRCVQ